MKPMLSAVPGKTYFLDAEGRKVGLVLGEDEAFERYFKKPDTPRPRRPAEPTAVWVSEQELPDHIPYSLKEIRDMRKRGIIKPYPDLRPKQRRVTYNLLEVSAQIRAGRPVPPTTLLQFNPDEIKATI